MDQKNYIDHLRSLSQQALQQEIESKIENSIQDILNTEEVSGEIANTNATGWYVDDYEIVLVEVREGECNVNITYSASAYGGQKEERSFLGDKIYGEAKAVIEEDGRVTYENVTAETQDWTN